MKNMKKVLLIAMSVILGLGLALGIITVFKAYQHETTVQPIDGMVYAFIVAKVEGNDDLLADLLEPAAQNILEEGRHPFPHDANIMGERYSIVRYDDNLKKGAVFYDLKFYRPSTGKTAKYKVMVANTPSGWKITDNSSIDETFFRDMTRKEEGKVVHRYGGRKDE